MNDWTHEWPWAPHGINPSWPNRLQQQWWSRMKKRNGPTLGNILTHHGPNMAYLPGIEYVKLRFPCKGFNQDYMMFPSFIAWSRLSNSNNDTNPGVVELMNWLSYGDFPWLSIIQSQQATKCMSPSGAARLNHQGSCPHDVCLKPVVIAQNSVGLYDNPPGAIICTYCLIYPWIYGESAR